jgi:hypothetical protein
MLFLDWIAIDDLIVIDVRIEIPRRNPTKVHFVLKTERRGTGDLALYQKKPMISKTNRRINPPKQKSLMLGNNKQTNNALKGARSVVAPFSRREQPL